MKTLAVIFAIGLGGLLFHAKEAECATCPSYTCYGSCAGADCACMKKGLETSGVCVSFNERDELLELGWTHY